ncbi:DUF3012 domain-containing protein [Pseudoteredinibacter isoporae]|uniref:DUF3012 domain-containing protein n=1 Tax=Pseudoteredinibacter isoporae TaxID=570281 RepID=A0A7X0JVM7_9GAMM|nr:DUF3012 domain-containing protein [Pseudoteredinibacter isoporae]MBB6523104.1 hypothetical protein [Pseudoteredinibacter isoporae]NHO88624.1 DUF3012 domain-containing protein [Pseudoteredinibacter isoporae]NIB22685.1 DUF3012 domain-containing protein [Pseudoteredinibacter isoporae]
MLKKLMIITLALSVLLLAAAAFIGPEQFEQWFSNTQTREAPANSDSEWCIMMEEKPNKEWREEEFQRFAKECLE